MKIRITITALALSLSVAVMADDKAAQPQAQPQTQPKPVADRGSRSLSDEALFKRYDTNKDGQVTADEFRGGKMLFNAYDADKDGAITVDEIKALKKADSGPNFRALDTDKDGFVTRREWQGTQEEFDAVDLDRDGVWSKLDRAIEKRHTQARGEINMFDTDKDGVISSEEWAARRGDEASFRRRDLDKNGSLDLEELATPVRK